VGAPYAAPPDGDFLAAVARNPDRLRIGFSTESMLGESTDPECVAAVERTAEMLVDLGHEVIPLDLPIDRSGLAHAYLTIVAACVGRQVVDTEAMTGRKPDAGDFEAPTWFLRQVSDALSARELEEALDLIARTTRRLGALFHDQVDVHVSATMPHPPAKVGQLAPSLAELIALRALRTLPVNVGPVLRGILSQMASTSLERAANTQVWNMTGQPAMSVPLHWTASGLPVGVQFAGAFGAEEQLFSLAGQIERVQPWLPRLTTPMTTRG
jgi:amidase